MEKENNNNVSKKKGNNGFVIGLLIGVIIMLLVAILLFATNTVSFSNGSNTSETDNDKSTNEQVETTESSENLDSERYASIIEEYKKAINDNSYNDNMDVEKKYLNINTNMLHLYHAYGKNVIFKYVFYDINNDKKNEMIVGDGSSGIYEVYLYDGNKPIRFYNQSCLGERCNSSIYDNGIIYFYGAGGAMVHGLDFYKIGSDGYSKETFKSYSVEIDSSSNVKITDNNSKEVTNYKSDNEVISSVVGNSQKVDLSKLSWIDIK